MTWTGTIPDFTVNEDLLAADLQTLSDVASALTDPWTPYTPTLTNLTLGNGTVTGDYIQDGKFITFRWTITFGSTTAITGSVSIGIPVTALDANWVGTAFLFDASTAANRQPGILNGSTAATQVFSVGIGGGGSGVITATAPFTWTTSDVIKGSGTYEAA